MVKLSKANEKRLEKLVVHMNRGIATGTWDELGSMMGISGRTAKRFLEELQEQNVVDIKTARGRHGRTAIRLMDTITEAVSVDNLLTDDKIDDILNSDIITRLAVYQEASDMIEGKGNYVGDMNAMFAGIKISKAITQDLGVEDLKAKVVGTYETIRALFPSSDEIEISDKGEVTEDELLEHFLANEVDKYKKKKKAKRFDRRSKVEIERQKALDMQKRTRHGKLNTKVAEIYKKPFQQIDLHFFLDNIEDQAEALKEFRVWVLGEMYSSYHVMLTKLLQENRVYNTGNNHEDYQTLDQVNGWFGTRSHKLLTTLLDSYAEYREDGSVYYPKLVFYITQAYADKVSYANYLGEQIKGLKEGESLPRFYRPFQTQLNYETTRKTVELAFVRMHYKDKGVLEEAEYTNLTKRDKDRDKVWHLYSNIPNEDIKRLTKYQGIFTNNDMSCRQASDVLELACSLTDEELLNRMNNETSDNQAQRDELQELLESYELGDPKQFTYLMHTEGFSEEELYELVMMYDYYHHAVDTLKINGATAEQVKLGQHILMQYIQMKVMGAMSDVSMYNNAVMGYIAPHLRGKCAEVRYKHGQDYLSMEKEYAELLKPFIPRHLVRLKEELGGEFDFYSQDPTEQKAMRKYYDYLTKAINAFDNTNLRAYGTMVTMSRVRTQLDGDTTALNYSEYNEVVRLMKDVMCLNEMAMVDWEQVEQLMSERYDYEYVKERLGLIA